ncbi:uncharacterized protein LOC121373474 [Gigantopelta aegis]|uniref:uncharacterized protein LOC121373474 n=1 Tax=Gigantopelta aegis TaxID=1735272 RepID=UPI001B88C628|nr:uncharacterized protein LOC121373474 [Gigantopelta aegis]
MFSIGYVILLLQPELHNDEAWAQQDFECCFEECSGKCFAIHSLATSTGLVVMLYQPLLAVIVLAVLVVCPTEGATLGSWLCLASKMMAALFESHSDRHCSLQRFTESFNLMTRVKCANCDKFFHCTANYNAVFGCQASQANRDAAETISNCRETGTENSTDSIADQAANHFGRNGGNCGERYLCAHNCMFNPINNTCLPSNCQ